MVRRRHVILALSLVVATALAARAQDDPRDVRIFEKLGEQTRMEFDKYPLDGCIEYLSDYCQMTIQLDVAELRKAGLSDKTPITFQRDNVRLWRALYDMLQPHKLSFMIKDHTLTITTREAAADWQKKNVQLSK